MWMYKIVKIRQKGAKKYNTLNQVQNELMCNYVVGVDYKWGGEEGWLILLFSPIREGGNKLKYLVKNWKISNALPPYNQRPESTALKVGLKFSKMTLIKETKNSKTCQTKFK